MKTINGGVTATPGFLANGLWCGIKRSRKPDLALIYAENPCVAAGVFTKNSIKAAPLIVSQEHIKNHQAQAIIVNSGNANCFTGEFGMLYAKQSTELIAQLLKIKTEDVLVTSTGIIGKPLPFNKIAAAAPQLVQGLSHQGGKKAAEAILTTDLIAKEIAVQTVIDGKKITIGACAKGSGMIAPNMATMLGFITTDAAISAPMLQKALTDCVDDTFNCITIDGCMSTNDMVTLFANGQAKNKIIRSADKNYEKFCAALHFVCMDLAKRIVRDGEGATKFLEILVNGAKSKKEARQIALAIANSSLVKTAAYGSNPNWGRVAAAVGALGLSISESELKISFSSFKKKNIAITVALKRGSHQACVYTTDLSLDYIKINGAYT